MYVRCVKCNTGLRNGVCPKQCYKQKYSLYNSDIKRYFTSQREIAEFLGIKTEQVNRCVKGKSELISKLGYELKEVK